MSGHTPLPWTLKPKPYASWIGSIGNNPDDPQLWSVATPYPKGDKQADAELIISAVNSHAELVKALEEIVSPVAALKKRAEADGRVLSEMAHSICNSPSYLQDIARAALATLTARKVG